MSHVFVFLLIDVFLPTLCFCFLNRNYDDVIFFLKLLNHRCNISKSSVIFDFNRRMKIN